MKISWSKEILTSKQKGNRLSIFKCYFCRVFGKILKMYFTNTLDNLSLSVTRFHGEQNNEKITAKDIYYILLILNKYIINRVGWK